MKEDKKERERGETSEERKSFKKKKNFEWNRDSPKNENNFLIKNK